MSMCARAVEANLSALNSSCAELGASATVHPDALAPLGQSCEVRLLAVEAFIRRVSPRIRVEVWFLSRMAKWMASPQNVWGGRWRRMAQTRLRRRRWRLSDSATTPLCCHVSCVVGRRSPCPLRNFFKFCPGELTSTIGTEVLDAPHVTMLLLIPGSKVLVGFESLIFGAEEGYARVARVVVCDGDNNICGPPDSAQERGPTHLSGLPHQICSPVVQCAPSVWDCGGSLHES